MLCCAHHSLPAGAYPFQITVTKTYNITNLFDDIKALYKIAGYKGQPVAFIFTDSEVKEEGFLEYINQVGHLYSVFSVDSRTHNMEVSC